MPSNPTPPESTPPPASLRVAPEVLAEVLRTEELQWRPARPTDYRAENEALASLARVMAETPEIIFQRLVQQLLPLCQADSSGISLLEVNGEEKKFRWVATAGAFQPLIGTLLPREFSPCGFVLDQNSAQLMVRPERVYPYISTLSHPVEEVLLVPFYHQNLPVGTVWVVSHRAGKHFDREDLRTVTSLSQFAAIASQVLANSTTANAGKQALDHEEKARLKLASDLSHARQRLDATLLAGEVGFYEWDVAANIVDGDQNFLRIFGMDQEMSPAGRLEKFVNNIHAEDRDRTMTLIEHSLSTGANYETDYRVVRNGDERWVRARGHMTRDQAGQVVRFSGVVLDITDRKQAEQAREVAVAESDRVTQIYDTILSSTDDFAYIFDNRGRFQYANRSLLKVWAKTLPEIVGKTCYELGYPTWHADMHMREIAQAIATKLPVRGEVPFTGGSGVSGIYDYIFTPVVSVSGNVDYIVGTTRDVTDRKQRADRDQLLIALDDATRPLTDPVEITQKCAELLGRHVSANRCAYADVLEDENTFNLTGDYTSRVPSIVGRYRFDQFGDECLRLMRAGEPFIVEDSETDPRTVTARAAYRATQIRSVICVPLHKSGRFVAGMALHQSSPRVWQPREVELLLLVANRCWESIERTRVTRELEAREKELNRAVQDLASAQHTLEQHTEVLEKTVAERTARLQETVSELEAFSYSVSHDLRGPLRVMRSFAQALREDCEAELNALGQDYIRRIVAGAERMDRVIQDVLEYSLVVRTELTLEPIQLDEFLRDLLQSNPNFDASRIEIVEPLPSVMANRAGLTQCLVNLIGNAMKFTAPGTVARVKIRAQPAGDQVRISVEDNGIGIEKSMQQNIFAAFYRLNHAYEGTGIGLALVSKAAGRMGGSVSVESEPGHGSTFHLTLPATPAPSA